MKQQYVLVQCLECQLFQVHIEKKKTPAKFTCTVCRCIQTIKRVFAKSCKASDCRKLCQEYNARPQPFNATATENDSIHNETTQEDVKEEDAFDGWDGFVSEEEEEERVGMPGQKETQLGDKSRWSEERDGYATHPTNKRKRDALPPSHGPRTMGHCRALSPYNTEKPQQQMWEDKGHSVLDGASHDCTRRIDTQNGETPAQDGDAWFAEYLA
ncbi:hypothetical protein M9435_000363 [Picochlorum sp. BPE23]|nr:hypothetical protein M9435_000363 [Picochlorum sp. BPE23]